MATEEEKAEALHFLYRFHKNWTKLKGGFYTALGGAILAMTWEIFIGF